MEQRNSGAWREPAPEGGLYLVTRRDGTPATGTVAGETVFYCFSFRAGAERLIASRTEEGLLTRIVYQSDAEWLRDWLESNGVQQALIDWGAAEGDESASIRVPARGLVHALAAGMATNVVKSWQP